MTQSDPIIGRSLGHFTVIDKLGVEPTGPQINVTLDWYESSKGSAGGL